MIRIHYLQHVPFEGLGHMESWALSRGHRLSSTRFHAGDPLPMPDAYDWLIIMGGPMNVDEEDRYPWLIAEKRLISEALAQGKAVLGICLGAQLIAAAAGARVHANPQKEIGWFPVRIAPDAGESPFSSLLPKSFVAFHWHGDTFEIPRNAVWLAMSEGCRNQAFALGDRVLALQFHLESTGDGVRQLTAHCGDEAIPGPFMQTPKEMLSAGEHFRHSHRLMEDILSYYERILCANSAT